VEIVESLSLWRQAPVNYDFTETEKKRLIKAKKRRKKLQKRLAKQQKESIGERSQKIRSVRPTPKNGISGRTAPTRSAIPLWSPRPRYLSMRTCRSKNMTKRAKPKQDENGKYIKNGAAAKSGLNEALLKSMWGMVIKFIRYKGLKKEKLTIKIPPHGTSQECSQGGHTHPGKSGNPGRIHLSGLWFYRQRGLQCRTRYQKAGDQGIAGRHDCGKAEEDRKGQEGITDSNRAGTARIKARIHGFGQYYGWPVCFRAGGDCKTHCGYSSQGACVCELRSPHLNNFQRLGGG